LGRVRQQDGNSSHGPLGMVRQQVMAIAHMALWVG
jgi:hypothetical protein